MFGFVLWVRPFNLFTSCDFAWFDMIWPYLTISLCFHHSPPVQENWFDTVESIRSGSPDLKLCITCMFWVNLHEIARFPWFPKVEFLKFFQDSWRKRTTRSWNPIEICPRACFIGRQRKWRKQCATSASPSPSSSGSGSSARCSWRWLWPFAFGSSSSSSNSFSNSWCGLRIFENPWKIPEPTWICNLLSL